MKTAFVIGLGKIGLYYDLGLELREVLTHSRAIALSQDFELIGAADRSDESCQIFSEHYNKPSFSNWQEGIRALRPDLVVVSSSTSSHYEIVSGLLRIYQPKGILCEKPFGGSAKSGREMLRQCTDHSVPIWVNFIRRSDPAAIKIKEMIEKRDLAGPFRGFCWYSKGLMHNGSHFIALLVYWFGPIRNWQVIEESSFTKGDMIAPSVVVRFDNATIHLCPAWGDSFEHHSIELISRSGRIRYDKGGWDVTLQRVFHQDGKDDTLDPNAISLKSDMNRYQLNVVKELAKSLCGKCGEITSGQEAVVILEYIDRIIGQI